MSYFLRRLVLAFGLSLLGGLLSGCIVYDEHPRGGWCYWHPYACR